MNKVVKLLIVLTFTVGCFATSMARKTKDSQNGKAMIEFSETWHNFGNINEKGGPVSHEFEFFNTGNGNLVIMDASAECGCTRPEYPKNPIAPGKKGKLKVTFNPLGRMGSFDKVVTVRTNGQPKKVRLKIKGTVVPKN